MDKLLSRAAVQKAKVEKILAEREAKRLAKAEAEAKRLAEEEEKAKKLIRKSPEEVLALYKKINLKKA